MVPRNLHAVVRNSRVASLNLHVVLRSSHVIPRNLHVVLRNSHADSRNFNMVSRNAYMVSRPSHMVLRNYHVASRNSLVVLCNSHIVLRYSHRSRRTTLFVWSSPRHLILQRLGGAWPTYPRYGTPRQQCPYVMFPFCFGCVTHQLDDKVGCGDLIPWTTILPKYPTIIPSSSAWCSSNGAR